MRKKIGWLVGWVFILAVLLVACSSGNAVEATAVPQTTAVANEVDEEVDEVDSEADSRAEGKVDTEPQPTNTLQPQPTDTPEPTNTPLPEPTETPEPTPEAAVSETQAIDLTSPENNLAQFDSYRLNIILNFTDSENSDTEAQVQIQIANITEPPASSLTVTTTGLEELEELESIAIAQIDDTSYMAFPSLGCITETADDNLIDAFGTDFLDTTEFTGDLDKARFVGETTINEIEVLHYEVDSSLLDEEDDLDEITGDIYLAQEGGYLVRMVIDGTGPVDILGTGEDSYGTMHMAYNLTDVNKPLEITRPEGCEENSEADSIDLPVTEDAYDLATFPGLTSYKSDLSFMDIVTFYETGLDSENWVQVDEESFVAEDSAVLVYTRDEEKVTVTIGAEDEDTQFVLMVNE